MDPAPALAVCLFGPTGTGKTALALELAREFPVEIISVDSAMVYRHMDIGTAKPGSAERAAVPHHLIDILDPWQSYSAGQFRRDALRLIGEIRDRGHLPLLVGGTLLYFRVLLNGLAPLPEADDATRRQIEREAEQSGWPGLHAELKRVDPATAVRLGVNDRQRIGRALEVYRLTGQPLSVLQLRAGESHGVSFVRIALRPAYRESLYRSLDARFTEMVRSGLLEEVQRLQRLPLMTADHPAMRAVGYRQIWQYLAGRTDLPEALRQAATATRRLAKRQLTWMQKEGAELQLQVPAAEAVQRIAAELGRTGVSRQPLQCNIMH